MKMNAEGRAIILQAMEFQRFLTNHKKPEHRGTNFLWQPSLGTNPAHILIFKFCSLELRDNRFLLLSWPIIFTLALVSLENKLIEHQHINSDNNSNLYYFFHDAK